MKLTLALLSAAAATLSPSLGAVTVTIQKVVDAQDFVETSNSAPDDNDPIFSLAIGDVSSTRTDSKRASASR